jgi:tripartite-type tricarboxylate transporter receptor subunit TctC
MEDFKRRTGIEMEHVPYRGAAPALNGLLGNEVSVVLVNLSGVEQYAKTGQVRLIAAATEKRVPELPDLPTVAETVPDFQTAVWFGLWGPAKMPPDLLAKIHADVSKALDLPETRQFFKTNSLERVDLSPQAFGKLIHDDLNHWSALIKAVGVKVE